MKKFISLIMVMLFVFASLTGCTATVQESASGTQKTENVQSESDRLENEAVNLSEGEVVLESQPVAGHLKYIKSLKLEYAHAFKVDYFEKGYTLLTVGEDTQYLIIPEHGQVPEDLSADITMIQRPIQGLYISTTPTMSLINAMQGLDYVRFCGTKIEDWSIDEVAQAMTDGKIIFAGKYNEPDYELLVENGTNLTIQSAMIDAEPDVVSKFNELSIPVIIDRGSNETHPLGKVEWLKFYAALLDLDMSIANELFDKQAETVKTLSNNEKTGKTVAIFYITSKGKLYVRNMDDYVTKMVELAGGQYIFTDLENSGSNSTTMEMEAFYDQAKDADYILYMYSTGGKPNTLEDLLEKNALISDFKAVKEGHVWATCPEFFQISDVMGNMIGDINTVLTTDDASLTNLKYLFKLK
ncbi:ABC transporter substrate-binding protein [Fusibacter sp. 3D3]|uniref:ABC transporter substrate-binding protein n=1 Tax=Fusibacter sp. 3D3 TaxID=1048380 RepID=UPI0008531710|nr:ABC transporter substrate-binding protein [Fusibacter sp. 3D3]GAU76147.1 vitamin B12 ABC transporter B12-binding component BtuF [Fusibacter sp. 3D3]